MGDPAGVGPEIIAKSLASPEIKGLADFFVVDDKDAIERAAPGRPTEEGARKALDCIDRAIRAVREADDGVPRAIVTAFADLPASSANSFIFFLSLYRLFTRARSLADSIDKQ